MIRAIILMLVFFMNQLSFAQNESEYDYVQPNVSSFILCTDAVISDVKSTIRNMSCQQINNQNVIETLPLDACIEMLQYENVEVIDFFVNKVYSKIEDIISSKITFCQGQEYAESSDNIDSAETNGIL